VDVGALWDELETSLVPLLTRFRGRLTELEVSSKPDRTLLSEADIAVQEHIVGLIRAADPTASIVAEEQDLRSGLSDSDTTSDDHVWIIDPIDGTAEFVVPGRVEFCSVVCLLEKGRPSAALVVAPEIGRDGTAVSVRMVDGEQPIVNGRRAWPPTGSAAVSVTRSGGQPRPWDQRLSAAGYALKIHTTSQTLDMVRTCVDLSAVTDPPLPSFALFHRQSQKVWDGAAGMCLAMASGLRVCDRGGIDRHIVDLDLTVPEPTFSSTVVGRPELVARFLEWSAS